MEFPGASFDILVARVKLAYEALELSQRLRLVPSNRARVAIFDGRQIADDVSDGDSPKRRAFHALYAAFVSLLALINEKENVDQQR